MLTCSLTMICLQTIYRQAYRLCVCVYASDAIHTRAFLYFTQLYLFICTVLASEGNNFTKCLAPNEFEFLKENRTKEIRFLKHGLFFGGASRQFLAAGTKISISADSYSIPSVARKFSNKKTSPKKPRKCSLRRASNVMFVMFLKT